MDKQLNFPEFSFDIRHDKGKTFIFDPVRKKQVRLTPEEWVRQNIVRYFAEALGYPYSHMVLEKGLKLNTCSKRADILIYDKVLKPSLLVECKSPEIKMTSDVFEQAARYNIIFKVPWLFVSNGIVHHTAYIDHLNKCVRHVDFIPTYSELDKIPLQNQG